MPIKRAIETPISATKASPKKLDFKKSYSLRSSKQVSFASPICKTPKQKMLKKTPQLIDSPEMERRRLLIKAYLLQRQKELENELELVNELLIDAQFKDDVDELLDQSSLFEELVENMSTDDEESETEEIAGVEEAVSIEVRKTLPKKSGVTGKAVKPKGGEANHGRPVRTRVPMIRVHVQNKQSTRATRSGLRY